MKYDSAGRLVYGFPLDEDIAVTGDWTFQGVSTFAGVANFDSTVDFDAAVVFDSTVDFNGALTLDSTVDINGVLTVDGVSTFSTTVNFDGAVDFDSTANFDGASTFTTTATFSKVNAANAPALLISSTDPAFTIYDTNAAVDEKAYRFVTTAGLFILSARSDDDTTGATVISANRTGTVIDEITIGGNLITLPGDVAGNDADFSGTIEAAIHKGVSVQGALTSAFRADTTSPCYTWIQTGGAADNKVWDMLVTSEQFKARVGADAENSFVNWLTVDRTANVIDNITLRAGTAGTIILQTATTTRATVRGAGGLLLEAGSATAASWPSFTAGTVLTTAEDGTWELDADCLYFCTDAGNRGIVPVVHMIRANATRTFTSNTSQQAIFNSPASGTLTLETGTYLFEGVIAMTAMSATSGNGKFSILGAGTATLGDILWQAHGHDAAAEAVALASGGGWHVVATQTAVDISTAAVATALCFTVRGTFTVTVAGTIIPSFAQTTAAAAVVSIGSYFQCNRIGSTSVVSVGQWT